MGFLQGSSLQFRRFESGSVGFAVLSERWKNEKKALCSGLAFASVTLPDGLRVAEVLEDCELDGGVFEL